MHSGTDTSVYSEKGQQMDEMGAQIAEKGGWSAGKRVQMVVFGEAIVMWEKGCLRQFLLLYQRKIFSCPGRKNSLGSMTNVTNDGVIFREGEFLEKVRNNFILI